MDKKFIILNVSLSILLSITTTTSEALFFGHPKKSFVDFFQSIKEKKENFKNTLHRNDEHDVHHYHLHYYPVPSKIIYEHDVFKDPFFPPVKHEFDHIHRKKLRSLGWTSDEYKHVPEPKIITTHYSQRHLLDPFVPPNYTADNNNKYDNNNEESDSLLTEGLTMDDQIDLAAIRHRFDNHHHHHQHHHREEEEEGQENSKNKESSYNILKKNLHYHHYYYYPNEISFNLPFNKDIVINRAPLTKAVLNSIPNVKKDDEKKKTLLDHPINPLIDFFQKLHRSIKNSFLHYPKDNEDEKKIYDKSLQ